jgi:acyl carrier protein
VFYGAGYDWAVPQEAGTVSREVANRERIVSLLADHMRREPSGLTDDKLLIEDLGFDDLDFIDVEMALEDMFDIVFNDGEVLTTATVGELVALVMEKTATT